MAAPGLIIAAPASGSGKTVVTLGLLRHLANAGTAVASAKVGPDYIDPAFHAAASGRACVNLDAWAMPASMLRAAAAGLARSADLVVCEGVMGLFDGATAREGSTADLAAALGWPVILIVDARAQAASAAAIVRGFATHRADVGVAGVVFNRIGSERHAAVIAEACALSAPEVAVLGFLPRAGGLALPERHLGLVQAREHPELDEFLDAAAAVIARRVDVQALIALARTGMLAEADQGQVTPIPPLGQRIAVAEDAAFAFRYALVTAGWRAAGAEILPFSPLADEAPDVTADAVYLPGGYPELHAGRLAAAGNFLAGLRAAAARGATVFGECGGYMVLGRGLIDAEGQRHAMAGLLPLDTSFADRGLHLGYRRATLAVPTPLGPAGSRYLGHEFHYARTLSEGPGTALLRAFDATGRDLGPTGLAEGSVFGSFVHLIAAGGDPW
ncbi:MAG: cobyrinate a,c-diamide synthase [Rhodospirillales bacterium]|jgi:cobyrinic acid a,c-diamide synthase|nr:cobyrinate a,c-diamide synthase [Rhodospirillales bacterium]